MSNKGSIFRRRSDTGFTKKAKLVLVFLLALSIASSTLLAGCSMNSTSGSESSADNTVVIEQGTSMADEAIANEIWDSFAINTSYAILGGGSADLSGLSSDDQIGAASSEIHNSCFSPASLYFALALAAAGAEGEAESQLIELLGVEQGSSLIEFCSSWIETLEDTYEGYDLEIANSIWANDGFVFSPEYLLKAQDELEASAFNIPFGTAEADEAISQWISEETEGLLNPRIQTSSDDIAKLINTIYFKDSWLETFDPEENTVDAFSSSVGSIQVEYLNKVIDSGSYAEGSNFKASQLAFQGGATMTFYLPDEGVSVFDLLQDRASIMQLFNVGFDFARVNWSLPKFTIDSSFPDLVASLQKLGVSAPFDPSNPGMFGNMLQNEAGQQDMDFYINDVMQETHLALDENGVEAAAYTSIGLRATSLAPDDEPIDFTLNRPFIYTVESPDGVTLFMGVVENPAE